MRTVIPDLGVEADLASTVDPRMLGKTLSLMGSYVGIVSFDFSLLAVGDTLLIGFRVQCFPVDREMETEGSWKSSW